MDLLVREVGLHVLKVLVMPRLLLPSGDTKHRSLRRTVFHPRFELVIVPQVHADSRDREKNGPGECEDRVVIRVSLLAKRRLDLLLDRGRPVEQIDFGVCVGEPGYARVNQVCTSTVRELGQCFLGEEEGLSLFKEGRCKDQMSRAKQKITWSGPPNPKSTPRYCSSSACRPG